MGQVRHGHRHGPGLVLTRRALAAAVLALGLVIPWGPVAKSSPPADPPTAEDAEAARAAVTAGSLDVRQAEAALVALRAELDAARVRAQVAAADYAEAQQAAEAARQEVVEARAAATEARAGETAARSGLAQVYRASARDGGLGPLDVALEVGSVPEMVGRSAAERAVRRKAGGALAEYQEARAAAESADVRWTAAKKQRDAAAEQAQTAYERASTAAAELDARTRAAEARRQSLVARLAELRRTSVRIEQEREAARAEAAAAAREEAAAARLEHQEAAADAAAATGLGAQGPDEPLPASGSGAAPAVAGPPTSGVTTASADRGSGAVAWARTKLGAPYLLGAAGPTSYDCSGLTMMSWASQGVDITRTSRSQYLAVGKVGYGSLRPGDLVFYGTDPGDPSSIYHVAMYTGGGMMIEATLPGHPLAESPLRLADAMPYAGRP